MSSSIKPNLEKKEIKYDISKSYQQFAPPELDENIPKIPLKSNDDFRDMVRLKRARKYLDKINEKIEKELMPA